MVNRRFYEQLVNFSKNLYSSFWRHYYRDLFSSFFSSFLSIKGIEKMSDDNEQEGLKIYVKNQLESQYDIALTNAITIASNYYVIESLLNNDRTIAIKGLQELTKLYKEKNSIIKKHKFMSIPKISKALCETGCLTNLVMTSQVFVKPLKVLKRQNSL